MPSRVIRGDINASRSLSRVSLFADLTFRALIVAVDDFGRLDARPAMLKAMLYPCRDDVTAEKLTAWVDELAEEGCVQLYEVDGAPFLCLVGWEKHRGKGRRGRESKYPAPPEETHSLPRNSRKSRKSEDCTSNPPEGRGTRDEGRESRDEKTSDACGADPPSEARDLTAFMVHRIREVMPDSWKPPRDRERWAQVLDLMHRRDGLAWDRIREVFRWANDDEFWRTNILSPQKLRKQFARLEAQMRAPPGRSPNDTSWMTDEAARIDADLRARKVQ